ncbi:bi-domain-containing oxidoreductase [bacterium]|nr:bi-domain-containing oxidoreductase [bacterium]
MRQVLQDIKTGEIRIVDVPAPLLKKGGILVQNAFSVISAGTERASVSLGQKSLLGKAKERPEMVKKVLDTLAKEGLGTTLSRIRAQLEAYRPMGYSSAGTVIAVGSDVEEFQVGDRVACGGGGYAMHAEIIFVPRNLCVKVPDNVPLSHAAFTTLGAIALQGMHQAEVGIGDNVLVIGLGLIGQLLVQLLKSGGCRVFGVDLRKEAVELALSCGMDKGIVWAEKEIEKLANEFTNGKGFDAVIITASTRSNAPMQIVPQVIRDRGRVVLVGRVGTTFPYMAYSNKELEIRMSRSYGPGRYDPLYEEKGIDYPIGYVPWTERRNMEEVVRQMSIGKLNLEPIITHKFPLEKAKEAYDVVLGKTQEFSVGVVLEYPTEPIKPERKIILPQKATRKATKDVLRVGFIGAGSFAQALLLPNVKKMEGIVLRGIATGTSANAQRVGERFGFEYCTTDYQELINDPEIDCIFIAARNNLHARATVDAVKAGKAVFVEKPLALTYDELEEVIKAVEENNGRIMVGFNRRFSPYIEEIYRQITDGDYPLVFLYRVNAGPLPPDHWVLDKEQGGGRIQAEVCHFVDTVMFIARCKPIEVFAFAARGNGIPPNDNLTANIKFQNESVASIVYSGLGDTSFPKERIEVFGREAVYVVDDFRELIIVKHGKKHRMKRLFQDKGHREEVRRFIEAVKKGTEMPIPFDEIVATTLTTLKIEESILSKKPLEIKL